MTAPPWSLSVATWNVLADAYIKPEHYPLVAPEDFMARHRHPRLDARVASFGTDVVCAQEVDYATFQRFTALLLPLGYHGLWAHRGGGKPDGCATFVREPWKLKASVIVHFDDAPLKRTNRVALMSVLARDGLLLAVANTHLEWQPPDAPIDRRVGLAQARQLITQLRGASRTIVCGDFNAEPASGIMEAFRAVGFSDAHDDEASTFVIQGRARKIDFLLHSGDLEATPVPPPRIDAATPLPSSAEPSDHIPLVATFAPKSR